MLPASESLGVHGHRSVSSSSFSRWSLSSVYAQESFKIHISFDINLTNLPPWGGVLLGAWLRRKALDPGSHICGSQSIFQSLSIRLLRANQRPYASSSKLQIKVLDCTRRGHGPAAISSSRYGELLGLGSRRHCYLDDGYHDPG